MQFITTGIISAFVGLAIAGQAQTFSVLHTFTNFSSNTNYDGANPSSALTIGGDTLYGTTVDGGAKGNGTVFKLRTDGTGFTNLHSFIGSDGAKPYAGLVLSGNTLYGTTYQGGSSTNGTVFKINIDGTGFAMLHSFTVGQTNNDGANPSVALILSNNTLYGTAKNGGASASGTVFKLNTDGSAFAVLHAFMPKHILYTFDDGANPASQLIQSGNVLYGTSGKGGYYGLGTVFKLNTDGTGFTNLYPQTGTSLLLSGSTLLAPLNSSSLLYKVNTDGTRETNFYTFSTAVYDSSIFVFTNRDGQYPNPLILSGTTLYGTASDGGIYGGGTIFRLNSNGTAFTNLYNFGSAFSSASPFAAGANPQAGLVQSGNTLYGTAFGGGIGPGSGTIFSLSLASTITTPQLHILPSTNNVVLSWTTNAPGFLLQTTPSLSPVSWTNVSPAPFVVSGQNTILLPISGTQQFYRLSQ